MLGRFFNLSSYIAENTPYYMVDAHPNILYTKRIVLKYVFCLGVNVTDKISGNHESFFMFKCFLRFSPYFTENKATMVSMAIKSKSQLQCRLFMARQLSRGPTPFPSTDHFGICPQKLLVFEVQSTTCDRLQALRFSSSGTIKTPRAASSNFK
jgi:hypothetical protein